MSGAFEVRISREALAEARAEVRRGARIRGSGIETGGMLLGAFDDATGIVHVDTVTGPPPDSYLSAMYFHHGVEGTQERVEPRSTRTAQRHRVRRVLAHPSDRPRDPSPTDEQGMAAVVGPDGTTRRALMMILGGGEPDLDAWRDGGDGAPPDVYVRVVPRSAGPVAAGTPGTSAASTFSSSPLARTSAVATAAGPCRAGRPRGRGTVSSRPVAADLRGGR